jgi:hypothetical protein
MTALTTRDLGPLADDPETLKQAKAREKLRRVEQRELMRQAADLALRNGGKHLSAVDRAIAKRRAAVKPLGRPLTTGEPT